MLVFNIVSTNNGKPSKSNTDDSKKRNKVFIFLSFSRFKSKTSRLLELEDRFNRTKTVRVIANNTRSIIVDNEIPNFISIRRARNNDISGKKGMSKKNIFKNFGRIF